MNLLVGMFSVRSCSNIPGSFAMSVCLSVKPQEALNGWSHYFVSGRFMEFPDMFMFLLISDINTGHMT
jgi:hypothetical protein